MDYLGFDVCWLYFLISVELFLVLGIISNFRLHPGYFWEICYKTLIPIKSSISEGSCFFFLFFLKTHSRSVLLFTSQFSFHGLERYSLKLWTLYMLLGSLGVWILLFFSDECWFFLFLLSCRLNSEQQL